MPVEELLVGVHQSGLAGGGEDLSERHVAFAFGYSENVAARRDGARGDQQRLGILGAKMRELSHQGRHDLKVEAVGGVGEKRRSRLDDDTAVGKPLPFGALRSRRCMTVLLRQHRET